MDGPGIADVIESSTPTIRIHLLQTGSVQIKLPQRRRMRGGLVQVLLDRMWTRSRWPLDDHFTEESLCFKLRTSFASTGP
jgi:hypothetical protein